MQNHGRGSQKRDQLLQAAEELMLQRGFWGTSVDDVCHAVGVSKGAFFHYFDDKEQLALAALDQFVMKMVMRVHEAVAAMDPTDAYGRICAYCDLVADTAQVQGSQQGCLIAAFVMETHTDDGAFAQRCATHFGNWIELLRREFVAALTAVRESSPAMSAELAQLCICVIEGALILARGRGDPAIVVSAMDHFQRYLGTVLEPVRGRQPAANVRVSAKVGGASVGARRSKPAGSTRKRASRRAADALSVHAEYEERASRVATRKESAVGKR
jgi:TetR/AcrR family transcriptional regulator, transcriptional repressor for nem operon